MKKKYLFGLYNAAFARAVVKARLAGRKTFRFRKNVYVAADHCKGVMADLRSGAYSITLGRAKAGPARRKPDGLPAFFKKRSF